jgi:hypothetical protein
MVNVTRLHNAAAACSYMRRITSLAQVRGRLCLVVMHRNSCSGAQVCNLRGPPDLCTSLMWCPRGLQDYAHRRVAFGRPLVQQPLALCTLAWLELRCSDSLALMLEVAHLLGGRRRCRCQSARVSVRTATTVDNCNFQWCMTQNPGCLSLSLTLPPAGLQEAGQASAAGAAMLRLLTPLAKLFTAKQAVAVCSEGASAALACCRLGLHSQKHKTTS